MCRQDASIASRPSRQFSFGNYRLSARSPNDSPNSLLQGNRKRGRHIGRQMGNEVAASLALNTVAGDNKINASEVKNPVTLSGASTGLAQGTVANITLNSSATVVAQGTVQANGSWTALLDAARLPTACTRSPATRPVSAVRTSDHQGRHGVADDDRRCGCARSGTANTQTVHYEVDFTEAVTGVTASSFALGMAGVSGASITGVSTTDNIHYTIAIDTGVGDGIISFSMAGTGIVDDAGNPLSGQSFRSGIVVDDVSAVRQIAVGDVNNDGLPDIVGAYINGGIRGIAWIKQTDGSFGTQLPRSSYIGSDRRWPCGFERRWKARSRGIRLGQ